MKNCEDCGALLLFFEQEYCYESLCADCCEEYHLNEDLSCDNKRDCDHNCNVKES